MIIELIFIRGKKAMEEFIEALKAENAALNLRAAELRAQNKADEAVFTTVRANVYDICATVCRAHLKNGTPSAIGGIFARFQDEWSAALESATRVLFAVMGADELRYVLPVAKALRGEGYAGGEPVGIRRKGRAEADPHEGERGVRNVCVQRGGHQGEQAPGFLTRGLRVRNAAVDGVAGNQEGEGAEKDGAQDQKHPGLRAVSQFGSPLPVKNQMLRPSSSSSVRIQSNPQRWKRRVALPFRRSARAVSQGTPWVSSRACASPTRAAAVPRERHLGVV